MSSSSSLLPLLAVAGTWYFLSLQGSATQTIWLTLNVLDTFRALRSIRPNGRRIGSNTRKRAMRDSLVCWIIYVVGMMVGPIVSAILGWIPFYTPLRVVVCGFFLFTRLASSLSIYTTILSAFLKTYETPIDLTFLLIQSLAVLLVYYGIQLPVSLMWTSIEQLRSVLVLRERISSLFPSQIRNRATDEHHVDRLLPHAGFRMDDLRAPLLSPGPKIPGAIVLHPPTPRQTPKTKRNTPRHPRRSIIVISPSPPSSPVLPPQIRINAEAGPSTPRRRPTIDADNVSEHRLKQPPVIAVRRSPRKRTPTMREDSVEMLEVETSASQRPNRGSSRNKASSLNRPESDDDCDVERDLSGRGKGKGVSSTENTQPIKAVTTTLLVEPTNAGTDSEAVVEVKPTGIRSRLGPPSRRVVPRPATAPTSTAISNPRPVSRSTSTASRSNTTTTNLPRSVSNATRESLTAARAGVTPRSRSATSRTAKLGERSEKNKAASTASSRARAVAATRKNEAGVGEEGKRVGEKRKVVEDPGGRKRAKVGQ
ncbi:hypothetical protein IAR55_006424 [Kwoniella newhampshirensis]|uniref:Uncharacterized protein n=1 Tax=Kwoniella newhampshirensis TaxID=1651941 RepID=A0AAW0YR66_9TREE